MDEVNGQAGNKLPSLESPFIVGLVEEVKRKLKKAVDASIQRGELLRQLFTDVALEVDNRARGLLYGETDQLAAPAASGGGKSSLCFYEVLAEHYSRRPEDGQALIPLFTPLWSQSFASQIFALLLHQWMHKDLGLLISRFFFFYEPPAMLEYLLANMPASMGNAFVGGPADVFVTELTNQLHQIKVEPVLIRYLHCSHALKGVELRTTTSIRLQTALYSMSSPGGPLFPTRAVRHAGWAALDTLYPVGRRFRHLISLGFRLLHPYYWPASFFNFVVTKLQSLRQLIERLFQRPPRARAHVQQQHRD
eukprot:jgi/Mesen1/2083/ME000151S01350